MSANKSAKLEQLEMRVEGTQQQHHISVNTRVNNESMFNLKARGSLDLKQSAVPQWQGKNRAAIAHRKDSAGTHRASITIRKHR